MTLPAPPTQPRNPLHGLTLEAMQGIGSRLRLERVGPAHPGALLHQRPQRIFQPEVPAQDSLGTREGRGAVSVHAARTEAPSRPSKSIAS